MSDTAFKKEQYYNIYPDGIENHFWNHARNRIISRFLTKQNLERSNILEIGCGRGIVLSYLRLQGINCIGVELGDVVPVAGSSAFIFAKTDMRNLSEEIKYNVETILLLDVIEHLKYPEDFFREIKAEFRNLKHLLITVPARQELWTNYDNYNGHYRRYNLSDIHKLSNAEFMLIKTGYFNHILYPLFWLMARYIKKRGTDIKAPSGIGIYINGMLSFILQADYWLFPSRLPGTSIIALFEIPHP
jgi:cyclopropane fatty-acyl-phospholipid synthase-like methyltransferase